MVRSFPASDRLGAQSHSRCEPVVRHCRLKLGGIARTLRPKSATNKKSAYFSVSALIDNLEVGESNPRRAICLLLLKACFACSEHISRCSRRCLSSPLKAGELCQTGVTVSKLYQVSARSKTCSGPLSPPPGHPAVGLDFGGWLARRSTIRHASILGFFRVCCERR